MAGLFITFEGGEGSGKTTQIQFLEEWFKSDEQSIEPLVTREPGGTAAAAVDDLAQSRVGFPGRSSIASASASASTVRAPVGFEPSERAAKLLVSLRRFMREHVYPNEVRLPTARLLSFARRASFLED